MSSKVYAECEACEGTGVVTREVKVSLMNSGGFVDMELECSECHYEGFVEVEVDEAT